jgi:hypothetical protein
MKTKDYPLVTCHQAHATDVIYSSFRMAVKVDLACAKEIVSNRLEFAEAGKHYLVVDVSNVRGLTSEAKAFLQNPEGGLKDILGAAIIASNPVSALIANIFIKTPKNFPAKFFSNKKEALVWIAEQKQKVLYYDLKSPVNQPAV